VQDKLLDMLMQEDEITWQSIILDLVKSGELDPWDVNISILTFKYLEVIRKMQEANLFISAKVLLASVLLLKIKCEKLLTDGIAAIDYYLYPPEDVEDLDSYIGAGRKRIELDVEPKLTVKTPMARKRRVTVNDLLNALEKALEVQDRRIVRKAKRDFIPGTMVIPEKKIDISLLIKELHNKIKVWFTKNQKVTFSDLIPGPGRKEKLCTFVPLLHLANQNSVDLDQPEHFGEIYIHLLSKDLNTQIE